MADQLALALEEEPFYLRVYALTAWGEVEIDRIQVNDPRLDPLDQWKVATSVAYVSIREAERLLTDGLAYQADLAGLNSGGGWRCRGSVLRVSVAGAGVKSDMLERRPRMQTRHRTHRFADGQFRFFAAEFGSAYGDAVKIFRVRIDRDPYERAAEKGIRGYDRILPALDERLIAAWLACHPRDRLLGAAAVPDPG